MSARWTEEQYADYMARHDHTTVQTADMERDPSDAPKPKAKDQEVHPRVCITVHHRSRRLADATGRAHKWAVDGLVRGGILIDDSPKFVAEIKETFETGKDQTIITIESVED